jgi:glycosyltransferase involved in cell wall biosynthesis
MWPALLRYVRAHGERFGLASSEHPIRAILLARQAFRRAGRQRLTWLLFAGEAPAPFAVARHYASNIYNPLLEREYQVCRELWERFPEPIVPQPISLVEIEGYAVFFEQAFPGSSLAAEIAHRAQWDPSGRTLPELVGSHLQIVGGLIRRMDAVAERASPADLEAELFQIYWNCRVHLGAEEEERLLLDAALGLLRPLAEAIPTRKRIVNLDLVPSNILHRGGQAVVVDWEYHRRSTLWPFEALKFASRYLAELERWGWWKDGGGGFEKYLEGQLGEIGGLVDRFLEDLGLPVREPRWRQALGLLYFLMEWELVASVAADLPWMQQTLKDRLWRALGREGLERARGIQRLAVLEEMVRGLRAELEAKEADLAAQRAKVQEMERVIETLTKEFESYRADKEIYIAQLLARLSWKRYRIVDTILSPLWYLRHPGEAVRKIFRFLPFWCQTLVHTLKSGALFNLLLKPRGPFRNRYVVEDNSCVILYSTDPGLVTNYEPRAILRPPAPGKRRVRVSLIAPAKNEARNLLAWWHSLVSQTRLPDEIIVVESGSTDGTAELLHELVTKSPVPMKVISAPEANIAQARNLAIAQAQYDIIACIDLGCRADPNWLEKLVTPFEMDAQVMVAAGWYEPIRADGQPVRHRNWWLELRRVHPQSFIPSSRSLAFQKQAWEAVGGYPEWLTLTGEDTYYALELKRYGGTWAFVPEAVVRWEAPDSVWAYLEKMFRWSVGDGESGIHAEYYWRYALALGALLALGGAAALGLGLSLLLGGPFWLLPAAGLAGLGAALPVASRWAGAGLDPVAWAGRGAAVVGFLAGARRRRIVEGRRLAGVKGTWFILSGVPIDDTGGGARATQVALELLRQGYFVVFISKFPRYESRDLGLRFIHPNLRTYRVNDFRWEEWAEAHRPLLDSGRPLAALVEFPLADFLPIVDRVKALGGRVVYDLIDDWATSLGGNWYRPEVERAFIDRADVLTATAAPLVDRLRELSGRPVYLLPNAVNTRLFVPNRWYQRPADLPLAEWVMMYVGALWGEWFDWELLIRLADAYPEAAVVVIGDYQGQCPEQRPNLHFLGLKPQRDLPAYLAHADVAIIPWKVNKITQATSPLKVYEYLAMHRPVVAPDIQPLRGIPGVWLAKDPEEFVRLASWIRFELYPYSDVERFINDNSWTERIKILNQLVII